MKFRFVGSGDAFGSGGRFNTCFQVQHSTGSFLIDFGATSMVALRAQAIDPNSIDTIFITHLHGDHFAGLPFDLLDAQLYSKRRSPLTIVGPYGLEERLAQAQEVLFPGSSETSPKYDLNIVELAPRETRQFGRVTASAFGMRHPCGAPPLGLRLSVDDKTIAYTGDTEWNDEIIELGKAVDLFVMECLFFEKTVPHHLSYASIATNAESIGAKRIVLTHFSPEMLAHQNEAEFETASDGLVLDL